MIFFNELMTSNNQSWIYELQNCKKFVICFDFLWMDFDKQKNAKSTTIIFLKNTTFNTPIFEGEKNQNLLLTVCHELVIYYES